MALCVFGAGMQWDVVQVFAWGRMVAAHSRTMPLSSAITKTFDGEMCGICRAVARAREQERSGSPGALPRSEARFIPFLQRAAPIVVARPRHDAWEAADWALWEGPARAPAVPPPRAAWPDPAQGLTFS